MAQTRDFPAHSHQVPISRAKKNWKILIIAPALATAASIVPSARAQLQQPLVFSSAGAVASRNDQTGALTPVAGSPFTPANQPLVLDVQGRFLFAIGTDSIHMYAITDSTTGAYQEVTGSPFASSFTNQPAFIAVEPTGQFIAVVNRVGQDPGDGSVEAFQISPTALLPVAGSASDLDSTPVGFGQPPNNGSFLVFMGPNPQSANSTIAQGSEFQALAINSSTGFITGVHANVASPERGLSFAMDPQGRYFVTGTRDNLLGIGTVVLTSLAADGPAGSIQLPQQNYPQALWIDSTGTFLYVATSDVPNPVVVNIYSVNLQTGTLTETASSPLPGATVVPPYFADPTGSFNYGFGADQNTAIAYTADPQTGYLVATANSPFTIPQIAGALTFSIPPGQEGISGPSASVSATSLSFGSLQTGNSSTPQTITLTSNGGEALSVTSISLGGSDPSQFTESDTCQIPAVLQPAKFCSISITFAPTNTGSQQATLTISDNAPGSPQSIQLGGVGVAPPPPAPVVTVTPNPLTFPTTTQGTPSSPLLATVTNTGNATLHISSVTMTGNNPGDFTMANGCTAGAYAANNGCTLTLTFTPVAAGQRSVIVTITDDAPNSPQMIQVGGTATSAPSTNPALSLSTTSVSFGAIAQGTTTGPKNVTVISSGGATLHISSVALGGANSGDFSITNGCTANAYAVNATCMIGISFAPLGNGSRSATITLTDDATNSPQVINLGGNASPAVTVGAAPAGSLSATVSPGQTAQFNLQITAAAGYSGTVSLAYGGAPTGTNIQGPSTLQVSGGTTTPFTVMVTTTGAAAALPFAFPARPFSLPTPRVPTLLTVAAILVFLFVLAGRLTPATRPRRLALRNALAMIALSLGFAAAGCGGGSTSTTAPPQITPVVTPAGAFIITVTPSANSAAGQPLQLQPIQLTLTVN
jgi:hypothetical protein